MAVAFSLIALVITLFVVRTRKEDVEQADLPGLPA
jgi:hypothetical protein